MHINIAYNMILIGIYNIIQNIPILTDRHNNQTILIRF